MRSPNASTAWASCGYCHRAKALLEDKGVKTKIIELDTDPNGPALRAAAVCLTRHRTVPSIWINQQHVGGYDNLSALDKQGKLADLLNSFSTSSSSSSSTASDPSAVSSTKPA